MVDDPLVSIVTPSYNQAKYLEATIQSVLRQEYPRIEYGIMDGGSTDSSLEIIQKHEKNLDWWVSQEDRGQAHAINKGIARSKGSIVAWLNSDDLYLPGAVSRAVKILRDSDTDLVFGDAITINAEGVPLNRLEFGNWGLKEFMRFRVICQPSVFIKRKVWEALGGLNQKYHYMLDHHLWIRIAAEYNIQHIPLKLAASRHHLEAKNVSQAASFAEEIYHLMSWMKDDSKISPAYELDSRRIRGGGYRLSARYLLEGGLTKKALADYVKALWSWPSYTLQHSHRIIFALFNLLTGAEMREFKKWQKSDPFEVGEGLDGWPGVSFTKSK